MQARLKAESAEKAKAAAVATEAENKAAESNCAAEPLRDAGQIAVQDSKGTFGPSTSACVVKKEVQSSGFSILVQVRVYHIVSFVLMYHWLLCGRKKCHKSV